MCCCFFLCLLKNTVIVLLNLAFTINKNTVNKKRAILTKLQNHHFKLSYFNYIIIFYTFFNFSSCSFCCLSRFNLCCLSCSALSLSSRMRRNLAFKALAFTEAWSLVIPFTTFREQNDYIIDFFGRFIQNPLLGDNHEIRINTTAYTA